MIIESDDEEQDADLGRENDLRDVSECQMWSRGLK